MDLAVGQIYCGKVTGITKFGAFVSLPDGKSGMVHISEISNSFVSDIREYLQENQEIQVKLIKIDDNGRLNLSIKKAAAPPKERQREKPYVKEEVFVGTSPESFEDKLRHFMQTSESKMADIKHNYDKKSGGRRRR